MNLVQLQYTICPDPSLCCGGKKWKERSSNSSAERCYLQTAPRQKSDMRSDSLSVQEDWKGGGEPIYKCLWSWRGRREHERQFIDTAAAFLHRRNAPCTCVTKDLHVRALTIRDYIIEINHASGVTSTIAVSNAQARICLQKNTWLGSLFGHLALSNYPF